MFVILLFIAGTLVFATDDAGITSDDTPVYLGGAVAFGTGSVQGYVFDALNNPVPGATVTLFRPSPEAVITVAAGADGSFSFTGLDFGTYILTASEPGHTQNTQLIDVAGDENINITLGFPSFDWFLVVHVTATGVNPSDINVALDGVPLIHSQGLWSLTVGAGGEEGILSVDVPNHALVLRPVTSADYIGGTAFISIVVDEDGPQPTPPPPIGTIRGIVLSAESPNDPIDGAGVTLINHENFERHNTVTDAAGNFSFAGIAPGNYLLVVAASGYNGFIDGAVNLASNATQGIHKDIYLQPGAYSYALLVRASTTDPTAPVGTAAEIDGDSLVRIGEMWYIFRDSPTGTVTVTAPGYLDANQGITDAGFQNYTAVINIALFLNTALPPGVIQGVVRDEAGLPLEGANVTLVNTATAARREAVTDNAGLYVFTGVAPGVYRLVFTKDGHNAALSANAVTILAAPAPGHHHPDQTLAEGPNQRALLVHLDDMPGGNQNPLGTAVNIAGIRPLTAPAVASTDNFWHVFSLVGDSVSGGVGLINATSPNRRSDGEVLAADYINNVAVISVKMEWFDIDVDTVPPRTVRGIVRHNILPNPALPNVGVTLVNIHTGDRMDYRTGPDGRYLFENVPDGEYILVFTSIAADGANFNSVAAISVRFIIDANTGREYDRHLSSTANANNSRQLIVIVRDQSGDIPAGLQVRTGTSANAVTQGAQGGGVFHASTHAPTLAPPAGPSTGHGIGALMVRAPGFYDYFYTLANARYTGTSGEYNNVAVIFVEMEESTPPAAGNIEGYVWRFNGPIDDTGVVLLNIDTGQRYNTTTNAAGFYQFTNIPHGRYHLVYSTTQQQARVSEMFVLNNENPSSRRDHVVNEHSNPNGQRQAFIRLLCPDGQLVTGGNTPANMGTHPGTTVMRGAAGNIAVPNAPINISGGAAMSEGPVQFWWSANDHETQRTNLGNYLFTATMPGVLQRGYYFTTEADDYLNVAVITIQMEAAPSQTVYGYLYHASRTVEPANQTATLINMYTGVMQQLFPDPVTRRFEFANVPEGTYRLVLTATNRASHTTLPFEITTSGPGLRRDLQWATTNVTTPAATSHAIFVHVVDNYGDRLTHLAETVVMHNDAGGGTVHFNQPLADVYDLWRYPQNLTNARITAAVPGFAPTFVLFNMAMLSNNVAVIVIDMGAPLTGVGDNIIHGQVTTIGTNVGVNRAQVTLLNLADGSTRTQAADNGGFFLFDNVADGEYRLIFNSRTGAPLSSAANQLGVMSTQILMVNGQSVEYNQEMTNNNTDMMTLVIRVTDQNGDPVPDARVWMSAAGPTPAPGWFLEPISDQPGVTQYWYRVGRVHDGINWSSPTTPQNRALGGLLMVDAPGFEISYTLLRATHYTAGPAVITIQLQPPITAPARRVYGFMKSNTMQEIRGTAVQDPTGPAVVLINLATGERRDTTIDDDGFYYFDNVTNGDYRLVFRAWSSREVYQSPIFTIDDTSLTHRYDRLMGVTSSNINRALYVILVDENDVPLGDQNPPGLQMSWSVPGFAAAELSNLVPPDTGAGHDLWRRFGPFGNNPGLLTVILDGRELFTQSVAPADTGIWENFVGILRVYLPADPDITQPAGTVYGRVTMNLTAAMPTIAGINANVVLVSMDMGVPQYRWDMTADAATGEFMFTNIPAGTYRLIFTHGNRSTVISDRFTITASGPGSSHREDASNVSQTSNFIHPVIVRLEGTGVESQRHPSPLGLQNFGTRAQLPPWNPSNFPAFDATDDVWIFSPNAATGQVLSLWKPGFNAVRHTPVTADYINRVKVVTFTLEPMAAPAAGVVHGYVRDRNIAAGPESGGLGVSTANGHVTLVNMNPYVPRENARINTTVDIYGRYTFTNVPNGTWRVVIPGDNGRISEPVVVNNDGHTVHMSYIGNIARTLFVRLIGMGAAGQVPGNSMVSIGGGLPTATTGWVNLVPPVDRHLWHLNRGSGAAGIGNGIGPLAAAMPGFRIADGVNAQVLNTDYVQGVAIVDLTMAGADTPPPGTVQGHARLTSAGNIIANMGVALIDVLSGTIVDRTTTDAQGFYQFTGVPNGTYRLLFTATNRAARFSHAFVINNNGLIVDENHIPVAASSSDSRVLLVHLHGLGVDSQFMPGAEIFLDNTAQTNRRDLTAPPSNHLWHLTNSTQAGNAAIDNPNAGTGVLTINVPGYHPIEHTIVLADYGPIGNTANPNLNPSLLNLLSFELVMDRDNPPPRTVRGFVYAFESGSVIPGANVALINMDTGARRDEIADASGFFQFRDVGAGTYRLVFTSPGRDGHTSHYFTLAAVNDGYHYDATLQNGSLNRVLLVRVVSPYFVGQYQPGMEIFLGPDVPENHLNQPTANHFWNITRTTGAGVAGGIGLLTATLPGFNDSIMLVQAGHYINNVALVTLPIGGVMLLPGTIMGNIWGLPLGALPGDEVSLPGANITLINQHTLARFTTTSNHSGFFRFDGLLPGTYSIFVSATGYIPQAIHEIVLLEGAGVFLDIILGQGAPPPTLFAIVQGAPASSILSIEADDGRVLTRQPSTDIWYLNNADEYVTLYADANGYVQVGTAAVDPAIFAAHGILFVVIQLEPEIPLIDFPFHKVDMGMNNYVNPEDPATWDYVIHWLLPGAHFAMFRYTGDTPLGPDETVPLGQFDSALGTFPANIPWELVWQGTSTAAPIPSGTFPLPPLPAPMEAPIDPRFVYHMVELLAPAGFTTPRGQWRIWYGPDSAAPHDFGVQILPVADHMLPPVVEVDGVFYFGNRMESQLPLTGGLGDTTFVYVLAASGGLLALALGLGGWLVISKHVPASSHVKPQDAGHNIVFTPVKRRRSSNTSRR
ncbi:MAG: carboxypeptidase regulatory-like domain-containing protein [Defluviitaleaceae bacterium]|nr:carboxypeptidase regulatory-like domain-containing protein [Defluviitaleaceae bacterium]